MNLKKLLGPFQLISLLLWSAFIFVTGERPDFLQNGFMAITMLFGSLIAGATSEGGGAVAFPVMTLIFNIGPSVARDFSLLIQSFGMTAATFIIFKNKIPISRKFLLLCLPASFVGQIFAFSFLLSAFSPVTLKITFTSLWLSYGLVLFWVKGEKREADFTKVSKPDIGMICGFAFLGGIVTALMGSGVDILTFTLATLFFHTSVKVATPTSVILMAMNSIFAVLIKSQFYGGIEPQAISYWLVCLPVVIFGAPFGALYISTRASSFIVKFLQISLLLQFLFSWWILPLNTSQKLWSVLLVFGGSISFIMLRKLSRLRS